MTQKQAKFENRNIDELKGWENNPRTILREDFDRLKGQIKELGFYKTLLVNQDNIVLGGNMRLEALRALGIKEVLCGIVETANEAEMLKYALSDNDQVGITDDLKLAEVFALNPIDTQLFKVQSNVLRPLESIINPPDPIGGELGQDQSNLEETLGIYKQGNVKQIMLFYPAEEYDEMIRVLSQLGQHFGIKNHTELVTKIIKECHAGIDPEKKAP